MHKMGATISDFVSGGFYITKPMERPECFSRDLLPARILSVSPCISPFVPDVWAIEWTSASREERLEKAGTFGISAEIHEVIPWVTSRFDKEIGWPNVCYKIDTANEFRETFLSKAPDAIILGIGLHKSCIAKFVAFTKPPEKESGHAPIGESGVRFCVQQGTRLPEGNVLGFELIVTDEQSRVLDHSWLCNGLEKYAHDKYGILLNANGFIERYDDALKCADDISCGEVGAEPGLWLPWLVVRY